MKAFAVASLILFSTFRGAVAAPEPRTGFVWEPLATMAVQDRGRLKPLETFAEESVQFITGKRSWQGLSAVEVVFSWLIVFDKEWEKEPFIRVDYGPVKKALGLEEGAKYFSPETLGASQELPKLLREIAQKENRKEKLTELEKKLVQLQNQRGLLDAIMMGQAWTILPNPEGVEKDWFPIAALTSQGSLPYAQAEGQKLAESVRGLLNGYLEKDAAKWNEAVGSLSRLVRTDLSSGHYPELSSLKRETHYNRLRPFRWSWVLYTVAFCLLLWLNVTGSGIAKVLSFGVLLGAFCLHTYGFILRCLIAGRPPVTNMYESVIWVTWGCVLFALLIWAVYRNNIVPNAAVVFAIVGLVLADNLPLALDPTIQPLEPVLRSNYWLTIHVLTITLSYAAFALSLCLGNVVMGYYLWKPSQVSVIQNYSLYMYRAMQIGVVLLAAGTILGGVWADYSWGRFWGWDPKEVWALIALLLYLAVLHGRFTGWLKGFGFAASTVVSFLGVLMAWYGVNFVLGVGLHSYGFGSGGMQYVGAYVAAQLVFIGAAYSRYQKAKDQGSVEAAPIFPKGAR